PVADAEDFYAAGSTFAQLVHDRRARGDGAAAEIVAIGEAAGNDDKINIRNIGVLMPDDCRSLAPDLGQGRDHVAVTVKAREHDDSCLHRWILAVSGNARGPFGWSWAKRQDLRPGGAVKPLGKGAPGEVHPRDVPRTELPS